MKILFVSNDLIGGNIARILTNEGHNVKLYIKDKKRKDNLHNIVPKTDNWKKELDWVGKDGLIVFDDVGYGKDQNRLRKLGYSVFGGSELADKFELDRDYGQKIFNKYKVKTQPLIDFNTVKDAYEYICQNPGAWVIKQNNHHYSKILNFVGSMNDGRDVMSILKSNIDNPSLKNERLSLQKRIRGIEIGVGRYFNGKDWVGPIEINLEHVHLFPNGIGPLTSEMGTLAWYTEDEENYMFKNVLAKIKPYLEEIDFRGDIEINCIANKSGVYALEPTARVGSPIIHLHAELHLSPWGEFMKAIADGEKYKLKYKKGYGIVTLIAVPPFPFGIEQKKGLLKGTDIFMDKISKKEFESIHFEEISKRDGDNSEYYISDNRGYVCYVTSEHKDVKRAREKTKNLIKKICIPKMFYRHDIGEKFETTDYTKLKEWGYI